jgi:hypothetical protein
MHAQLPSRSLNAEKIKEFFQRTVSWQVNKLVFAQLHLVHSHLKHSVPFFQPGDNLGSALHVPLCEDPWLFVEATRGT